jgi:hypothetical protein
MNQLYLPTCCLLASLLVTCVSAESPSRPVQTNNQSKSVSYHKPVGLFENGEKTASFLLREFGFLEQPSPEKELLNGTGNQQAIAQLLKEERNRYLKPGLTPPDDKHAKGIKVRFDGIRFLKDPKDPDQVRVRLVGPINEIEYKAPLSVKEIIESERPIPIRFESVTKKTGVTVKIITDVKLKFDNGDLIVSDTTGSFDFAVGRFSPARLLYSSDFDRVALPDLIGKRVSEDVLPMRTLLDPEKL